VLNWRFVKVTLLMSEFCNWNRSKNTLLLNQCLKYIYIYIYICDWPGFHCASIFMWVVLRKWTDTFISYVTDKPRQVGPNVWEAKLCLSHTRKKKGVIQEKRLCKKPWPIWLWIVPTCKGPLPRLRWRPQRSNGGEGNPRYGGTDGRGNLKSDWEVDKHPR
jgi:hypothetical protein